MGKRLSAATKRKIARAMKGNKNARGRHRKKRKSYGKRRKRRRR